MNTLASRARRVYQVLQEELGGGYSVAFTGGAVGGLQRIVRLGQKVDELRFSELKNVPIDRPIVIAGLPRTGTTFLHRFLHSQKVGVGQELWQQVYSSITIQQLVRPLLPHLERFSPARYHKSEIHKTGLREVETDDTSLLLRYFDGFFVYGFFLAFAEDDLLSHFDPKIRDTNHRDFTYIRRCWQRSLLVNNHSRVLSKMFSLGASLPAFLTFFPDAKVIYTARDPTSVIPSTLSLLRSVLQQRFDFARLPKEKQNRYYQRVSNSLIELMLRFHQVADTIPNKNLFVLPYRDLKNDFADTMERLAPFLEIDVDITAIRENSSQQKRYKSKHSYTLSEFGLSAEQIEQQCAFFERYWK